MTEKPILFCGEMVKPVLDGSKTHTRRVMNFHRLRLIPRRTIGSDIPIHNDYGNVLAGRKTKVKMNRCGAVCGETSTGQWLGLKPSEFDFVCPYATGQTYLGSDGKWHIKVDDAQLWVRETWSLKTGSDFEHSSRVYYKDGTSKLVHWMDGHGIGQKYGLGNEPDK